MELTLQVLTPQADIEQAVLRECRDFLQKVFTNSVSAVADVVRKRTVELIQTCPEYDAMVNGDLAAQLGVADARSAMDAIAHTVADSVVVQPNAVVITGGKLSGGLTINLLRSEFDDVLAAPYAQYVTKNGSFIPWLQWLLFAGNSQVITGYTIVMDPNNPDATRAGAIMVPKADAGWSVPDAYAGTPDDNFLTRALAPITEELDAIIESEINKRV